MTEMDFRRAMVELVERVVSSKENLEDGQWIDFYRIKNDFSDIVAAYLNISL